MELDARTKNGLLRKLRAAAPADRDRASEELGDWLESGTLSEPDFRQVVGALIPSALAESDPTAKESMFNALSSAAGSGPGWRVDWGPIASNLDTLGADCLEHALVILGFSGDGKYKQYLERYRLARDEAVRVAAVEGIAQLEGARTGGQTRAAGG